VRGHPRAAEYHGALLSCNGAMATPAPTPKLLAAALDAAVNEFLHSQDVDELARRVDGARAGAALGVDVPTEFVKRLFVATLSTTDEHTEQLYFSLVSLVVRGALSPTELAAGVDALLARVADYALDYPGAPRLLVALLSHLVQEDVLSDGVLRPAAGDAPAAGAVRQGARALLSSTSTPSPLSILRGIYRDLVTAFFDSGDIGVLTAGLASLHARHTLHEVVRKTVQHCLAAVAAADGGGASNGSSSGGGVDPLLFETASDLLQRLVAGGFLPAQAAVEGFLRLLRSTADFAYDVPQAATIVPRFLARALGDGVLPRGFLPAAHAVLTRGRASAAVVAGGPPSPTRHTAATGDADAAVRGAAGRGWVPPPAAASAAAATTAAPLPGGSPLAMAVDDEAGGSSDDAHATRAAAAALDALTAAAALCEGYGSSDPATHAAAAARLARVWGYSGPPLAALRSRYKELVDVLLAAGNGDGVAAAGAAVDPFADGVAALGPAVAGTPGAPAPLHPTVQCDVVFELIHTPADQLLAAATGPSSPSAGAADEWQRSAREVLAALGALLQRGVVAPPPACRALARALQSLEDGYAVDEDDEDGDGDGDDEALLLTHPLLGPFLGAAFTIVTAAGGRPLDLLAHPSACLSALLAARPRAPSPPA
jgi:hypothetical protein